MTDIEVQTVEEFQQRTDTTDRIWAHYDLAKEKHPYFCDAIAPVDLDEARRKGTLADFLCKSWEICEDIANGDTTRAAEKCYDAIAVLLRTIDVLEGRQALGRPDTISCNDAGE